MRKVEAIKKAAIAVLSMQDSDFTGTSVVGVLKDIAVYIAAAQTQAEIKAHSVADVLNFIADNFGEEEKEPYALIRASDNATIVVKRGGKVIQDGNDVLYNGDKLTITATAAEGYTLDTLQVNGEDFVSGKTYTVNGGSVLIEATATEDEPTT